MPTNENQPSIGEFVDRICGRSLKDSIESDIETHGLLGYMQSLQVALEEQGWDYEAGEIQNIIRDCQLDW